MSVDAPTNTPLTRAVEGQRGATHDGLENGQTSSVDAGPEGSLAPESVKRFSQLAERLRGAGVGIDAVRVDSKYRVDKEGLAVPMEQAIERAEGFKSARADDFIFGEALVQLARTKASKSRYDPAVATNPALKIAIELTDTMACARMLIAHNPQLEGPVSHYVTTLWGKVADQMSASDAPKHTRALLLSLVNGVFPDAKLRVGQPSDNVKELLEVAQQAFDALTAPPAGEALSEALGDGAEKLADQRRDGTKEHLWPVFAHILTLELPEPEKPEPRRGGGGEAKVVSAAEARKRVERRRSQEPTAPERDAGLSRFLEQLKREPLWRDAQRGARVSPSEVRRVLDHAIDRGRLPEVDAPDRYVAAALEEMGQFGGSERSRGFAKAAESIVKAPWEPSYLTPLNGPKPEEIFEPIPSFETFGRSMGLTRRQLEAPTVLGRSLSYSEEKSHYRTALREQRQRYDELRNARQIARALADGDGLSAALGNQIESIQSAIVDAIDRTLEVVEDMGKGAQFSSVGESRRAFLHGRDYVERLFQMHERVLDILTDAADTKFSIGGLLGTEKKSELTLEGTLVRIKGLAEKQRASIAAIERCFHAFPEETSRLRELLAPRLEWRAKNLERDPAIVLSDAGWLPTVAAELERAQATARALAQRIDELPAEFPGRSRFLAEREAAGDLRALLVADVTAVLHERLSGHEPKGVSSEANGQRISALPPLARFPHLAALAVYGDAMELDLSKEVALDGLTAGLFRSPRFPSIRYDPSEHAAAQKRRLADAIDNFSFWCRSIPLETDAESLTRDFEAWGAHFASGAAEALLPRANADEVEDDDTRRLERAYATAHASEPQERVEDDALLGAVSELREKIQRGAPADEIRARLSWPDQPVAVLQQLSREFVRLARRDELIAPALEAVETWFASESQALRDTALKLMSRHHDVPAEQVMRAAIASETLDPQARANVVSDITRAPLTGSTKKELLAEAAADSELIVRGMAAGAWVEHFAAAPRDRKETFPSLARFLEEGEPSLAHFVADCIVHHAERGVSELAEMALGAVRSGVLQGEASLSLMERLAASTQLPDALVVGAKQGVETLSKLHFEEARSRPRPVRFGDESEQRRSRATRSPAARVLEASRSEANGDHAHEANADRIRLALHHLRRFEEWSRVAASESERAMLEKLDLPVAILEGAFAHISGQAHEPYLAKAPAIARSMVDAGYASDAEAHLLVHGDFPEALRALADTRAAREGKWEGIDLRAPEALGADFADALRLNLLLNENRVDLIRSLLGNVMSSGEVAGREASLEALREVAGVDLRFLDGSLPISERRQALAQTQRPSGPAGEVLERAVIERLLGSASTSDDATLLIAYLRERPEKEAVSSLTAALEQTEDAGLARALADSLAVHAKRLSARRRSVAGAMNQSEHTEWSLALLAAHPKIEANQLLAARDGFLETRRLSANETARERADLRVTEALSALFDRVEDAGPEVVRSVAGMVSDLDDDRERSALVEGLKKLASNPRIELSSQTVGELRDALLMVSANRGYADGAGSLKSFVELVYGVQTSRPELVDGELGLLAETYCSAVNTDARKQLAQNLPRVYQRATASGHELDLKVLKSIALWLNECDRSNSGTDRDRARRVVLERFADLLPLHEPALNALLERVAILELDAMEEAVRACADACRMRPLTPEDVERATERAAKSEEQPSRFGGLVGQQLRKLNWMPAFRALSDPTDSNWRDAENIRVAKRHVRASMQDVLKVLSLERQTDFEARVFFGGSESAAPAFASRFSYSGRGERQDTDQLANPNVRVDRGAQRAATDQRIKEFRDKRYEGMRPYDRWSAQGQTTIRALSAGIDQLFDTAASAETEPSARGGKLNVQRFIQAKVHHEYARANSEDGDGGGLSLGAIFDAPVSLAQQSIRRKILNVTLVDHSGSTADDNRLGFFLGNAVVDIEAFERVKNVEAHTALIGFADRAQILLAPRHRHSRDAKVAAIESLRAHGGTNDFAAAKELEDMVKNGAYDLVIVQWLTDGRGQNSTPALLRELVRKYPHMRLAGQGVSQDAGYVRNLFPYSVVHDDPVMLGKAKYRFIKDEVLRGVR